jgi:hypothetical protein
VAAGLLAAVSPAGIDESTFIWNPNLIPAAAALAFGAAVMAHRTGRARWWVACGVGAMVTMQCHVLGVVIVLPLGWAWVADLIRRRRAGQATRGSTLGGLGAVLVIGAGFLPLLVHELTHDFAETRGIVAYVAGGGAGDGAGVIERIMLVGLRSITWPVTGLITDRPTVSLAAAMIVALLIAIAMLARRRGGAAGARAGGHWPDVPAARWLAGALGVSVVLLAVFAPSLAVIVPELPNDHYHAFLDPIVLALVGVALARLWSTGSTIRGAVTVGSGSAARASAADGAGSASHDRAPSGLLTGVARIAAGALAIVLAAIAVTAWPPRVAHDGGWPLVDEAAVRVRATTGEEPVLLAGLPPFKSADALRFPLVRRGTAVLPEDPDGPADASAAPMLVIVCDPLFDEVVGAACGGPAEDAWLGDAGLASLPLRDRFEAGPRRVISVYATR